MTESEQATRGFKRPAAQPLDRENLPEEFTVQFIKSISNQDAIWLEREADLTELQRSSLQAAMTELLGPVTESARKKLEAFTKDLSNKFSFPKADRLGVEIIGTLAELDKTIAPSPRAQLADLDLPVVRRHEEQQKNLRQLETLLRQLVERTEQQHRAAERQRITNWLLAWIAGSSMIGTFATSKAPADSSSPASGSRLWAFCSCSCSAGGLTAASAGRRAALRDASRDAKWCQTALAEWLDEARTLTSGA